MAPAAFGQNAANQVSTSDLTLVGTTAVTSPATTSGTRIEGRRRPGHDIDLSTARLLSARGAPPATALTLAVGADNTTVDRSTGLGFPGLTHQDQRSAGTGKYANSQFSTEPPDQALAVGNGFVLEVVNSALAVYDQRGKLLKGPTALNQFFGLAPEIEANGNSGDFVTDPDCYFDQDTQRWFITISQVDVDPVSGSFGPRAHLLIAVSKTNDPTDEFRVLRMDVSDTGDSVNHPGCPCFADQPHAGADANGFYISTNEFNINSLNGGSVFFNGAQIYAMSKKRLADGKLPAVVHFANLLLAEGIAFTVEPAKPRSTRESAAENSDDKSGGIEYFLSAVDIFNQVDNRIAVWAISNTSSLSNSSPNVKLQKAIITSEVYGPPPSAEQKSGPTPLRDYLRDNFGDNEPLEKLHTNNDRMQPVVFADGKLWGGLNTVVQQKTGQRAGIAFFSVAPSIRNGVLKARIAGQGYLSVPGEDVLNPAIGVDRNGNAAMVFTLAGPDHFPSVAFVKITGEEKQFKVHIVAPGVAPEDGCTGYDLCAGTPTDHIARWGDYSAATTDENGNVWLATEFIPTKSSGVPGTGTFFAHWGTFVARVPEAENP